MGEENTGTVKEGIVKARAIDLDLCCTHFSAEADRPESEATLLPAGVDSTLPRIGVCTTAKLAWDSLPFPSTLTGLDFAASRGRFVDSGRVDKS